MRQLCAWVAGALILAPLGEAFTRQEVDQGFRNDRVIAKPRSEFRNSAAAAESAEGMSVHRSFPRMGDLRVLAVGEGESAATAMTRLRETGRYEYVEADRILYATATPNDPQFGSQWPLANTGQSGGTAGADIDAATAWDSLTDASVDTAGNAVVVAIVDSGARLTHSDLLANLWTGTTKGNHGINALVSTTNSRYYLPSDDNGHGTHVAGIIGAVGNNGVGTAGVSWTAQMMPLKFMDSSGSGSTSDEIECIAYAVANGAKVINASYGSSAYSSAEYEALAAARDAGVIVVVAAGNDGTDNDSTASYPSSYALDNLVVVASTDRNDELSSFSNYGVGSVDLAAPGESILSTYNTDDTATATLSGTSMAAPHVTGAIALLWAQHPTETYRQIINRLLRSTTRLGSLEGMVQTAGRLDLARTLASTSSLPFNDRFIEAAALAGEEVRVRTSNSGATAETGEPAHAGVSGTTTSLWWTWTAPLTTQVVLDTAGSDYDTILAVYTGTSISSLSAVASNDDADTTKTTSRAVLSAIAGATYRIAIAGKAGAAGYTALRIGTLPPHDAFASAKFLTGNSVHLADSNRNGSAETGEPVLTSGRAGHSVWYRWTAPTSGRYTVAAYSSVLDTVLGVYTGSSVGSLTAVAVNDNSYTVGSAVNSDALVSFDAVAGTTYRILVDNTTADGSEGDAFILTLSDALWASPAMDEVTSSPAVGSDGSVYFGSTDGYVYAVSADGTRQWRYATGDMVDLSSPAIGSDGTIYIGSGDGYLYAFDPTNSRNRMKWKFTAASGITSTPAIASNGTIYVRDDVALYAIGTSANGSLATRWKATLNTATVGGTYASPTVAADGTVYIGTTGGTFAALTDNGSGVSLKWRFAADGDIYTSAAIGPDGAVYFATLTGTLYALEPSGSLRWSWNTGDGTSITSSPAVGTDGTVYFAGYDKKLHAIDRTGAERWSYQLGDEVRASSPAIDGNGTVYVGCYDGLVYAVGNDGNLVRTYPTAHRIRSSPVIAGTRLYFGSSDAKVHAYALASGAASSSWPMFQHGGLHTGRISAEATTIATQPESQTVTSGDTITLEVSASSTLALTYQWYKDGVAIDGATSATYTIATATAADAGTYSVVITSSTGSVTSTAATVTILTPPTLSSQDTAVSATVGASAKLSVTAADSGLTYQWYRAGQAVTGIVSATQATLSLGAVAPSQAGLYDCLITGTSGAQTLSRPIVLGVLPTSGSRTAGSVVTRDEWQNIQHANGNTYDQFLLSGTAGTFTADAGQIARMSFLDPNGSIVQVEMSGSGAVTVVLDGATGPVDPLLYNQSGIQYMQGKATVVVAGADQTTHVSMYSVGPGNNPGVVRTDATYNGWARATVLGIAGSGLGGIHMGNGSFSASAGYAGLYAPNVTTVAQLPVVIHDIDAADLAQPCLVFSDRASVQVRVAGGDLGQTNGDEILTEGIAAVTMADGQSSNAELATAQVCAGEMVDSAGTSLNGTILANP